MDITIKNVRFSYCTLTTPRAPFGNPAGDPVYSTVVLIPKTNTEAKAALDAAIEKVKAQGVSTKWGGILPGMLSLPIHDGDGMKPRGGAYGPECKGMWVINAKSKNRPFIVDRNVQEIIDPAQIYSGMWGNVSLSLFAYSNSGNNGISVGLNGVQKIRDDEALGGAGVTAQDAFQAEAPAVDPITGAPI